MKREDLRGLGIEDNIVNAIMALHGQDITALNDKVSTLETERDQLQEQVNQRDTQLAELKDNSSDEALKQKINELTESNDNLKSEHEEAMKSLKKEHAIDVALMNAKARNVKTVKTLLDLDNITLEDDQLKGIDEALDAVKESDPYLFATEEASKPKAWSQGGLSTVQSGNLTKDDIMKIQDRKEKELAIAQNMHLFRK